MFVTPVFVSRNVLDPAIYASKRASLGHAELSNRLSIASTNSSVDLHRTSSTSSAKSTSTTASSVSPTSPKSKPQHRKALSGSSLYFPRRFQRKLQKSQAEEAQRLKDTPRLKEVKRPKEVERQKEPQRSKGSQRQSEPVPTKAPPPPPFAAPPSPSTTAPLSPSISNVPESPKPATEWQCSDLVVRCKSDVYHVDRVIMCYHSRWFAKVCAILVAPKASKSVIDLSADDPDAVAAMMQYCYQLDYTDQLSGSDTAVPEVVTLRSHVDVFMLAERYGIDGLKRVALQKFEDLAAMVLMVEGNEEQLLQAIRAMYAPGRRANADELRHVAVQLCAGHVESFLNGTERTIALVFESMDELPEFRADLFEEMAARWK